VEAALERWQRKALLSPDLAESLKAEAREHSRGSQRRTFQYVLAGTGALILLIAAGVFADWLWPRLQYSGRAVVLGIVGVVVHGIGLFMREGERWRAASYLLQIAGLLILLFTFAYSDQAWPSASLGGVVVGLIALAIPLVTAPRSFLRRDPVMPAAHLALSLAFLAMFLWRTFGLAADTIIWILDGVLAVMAVLLVLELHRSIEAESEWALYAFVTAMYAGFVLIALTGLGPFDLETDAVYPMDLWLAGIVALALWGIHLAPPTLQRGWYERHLALAVLISIPLVYQSFDNGSRTDLGSAVVAVIGAAGLRYSIRYGARATLFASCFAIIVAAWVFGVDRGGAIGVVLALGASAAFLFWVSTRVGWTGGVPSGDSDG
jgi:hypothetical protein